MQLSPVSYFLQAYGPYDPALTLSASGRLLAYASYVEGGRRADIIIADTVSGGWRLLGGSAGALAASHNYAPSLAAGGSALALTTVAAGEGAIAQIAVNVFSTGSVQLASASDTGVAGNGASRSASLSGDARYVVFTSSASNLVAGDTNGADDVFLKDLASGAIERVSLGASGQQLAGHATGGRIADNGKVILFQSSAPVLPGVAAQPMQLYARALDSAAVSLVAPGTVEQATLSGDGRYVVFTSATRLGVDRDDSVDVFRKDLVSGELVLVSVSAEGVQGSGLASAPSISADGRFVSFSYDGGDLLPSASTPSMQVYVKDLLTGELIQALSSAEAGQGAYASAISGAGASLAYVRYAGTTGPFYDVTWDIAFAHLGGVQPVMASVAPALPLNRVNGGLGVDTLAYAGRLEEYAISAENTLVQVRQLGAVAGVNDALSSIERLQFADAMYALDTGKQGLAGQAYRIYQAAFDRAPDAAGVGFWIGALDAGQSLESIAAGFVASSEFLALYGSAASNADIVARLYFNVLNRPGEAAGITFWSAVLDQQQASLAQVLAAFSESPENVTALNGVIGQGFAYLPYG
ncbi:MAG: DUF4214 domain-containing protein [Pseudomonadota bacterium]